MHATGKAPCEGAAEMGPKKRTEAERQGRVEHRCCLCPSTHLDEPDELVVGRFCPGGLQQRVRMRVRVPTGRARQLCHRRVRVKLHHVCRARLLQPATTAAAAARGVVVVGCVRVGWRLGWEVTVVLGQGLQVALAGLVLDEAVDFLDGSVEVVDGVGDEVHLAKVHHILPDR